MDPVAYNYIGISCSVLLAYLVWAILNFVWLTPKRIEKCLRKQGLKGNSYKLLLGDMGDHTKMMKEVTSAPMPLSNDIWPRVFPLVHRAVEANGKNSFVWFGPKAGLVVTDPEIIKEILSKNFKFPKQKMGSLLKLLLPGLADYDGEKWAKHRKIINPAFHLEKLKLMVPALHLSCMEMLSKWDDLVMSMDGVELDVWPYIRSFTSDAISRTAFGSNYKEGSKIFELQQEQSELVVASIKSIYIPGWRFLPTRMNRRMNAINKEVNASLKDMINKRVKAIETSENSKSDLLGILLDSNVKEMKQCGNDKNLGMSIDEVIEECKLFYFAGQETTSGLLVWTLILLSWHQNWQHRAREEVLQVLGNDTPNFESLNHLKVMTMILHEVLRLYSPTFALTRTVYEETKLGEICVPAKTILFLPTTLLHHDREVWGEDAKEFKPERFSDGVSKATKNRLIYFPFGWGPRVCIAQNFAMLEAKMALTMLLQRFSFELSPSYAHAPFSIFTVQPQYGAHLILRKL